MKHWLNAIFYTPKHEKTADDNILRLLLPSFVGIILCMVCLAGSTWAWFTSSIFTPPQTIAAANYKIEVTATDAEGAPVDLTKSLTAGQPYEITLTATGTADKFGGYCIVECGEKPLYTEQIFPGDDPFTFILIPPNDGLCTFTAVWGNRGENAPIDIVEGAAIGQEQPDNSTEPSNPPAEETNTADPAVYSVQSGDTLWDIAKAYDTTVSELIDCNEIEDPSQLQIGQEVKIPTEKNELPSSSAVPGNSRTG